ncbi:MAG TPA: Sir2 family NAD-dependent protein deacetylase [Candidatus Dormibacteraeota bacterium]
MSFSTTAELEGAAVLLAAARQAVVFTGAGVSTESGIRDFRGPNGIWKERDPYKTSSIQAFREDPSLYWSVSRERWQRYHEAQPNAGHYAIAAMEEAGYVAGVVTQNTDGLHLAAGSRRVIELHGNGRTAVCLDCGAREPRADVQARLAEQFPPQCGVCHSRFIKPAVVFFGEPLPAAAVAAAYDLAAGADLMLVAGSSLQVYPAADVPLQATRAGAPLVIVNEEPTPFDRVARLVIRGRTGEVLPQLLEMAAGGG